MKEAQCDERRCDSLCDSDRIRDDEQILLVNLDSMYY